MDLAFTEDSLDFLQQERLAAASFMVIKYTVDHRRHRQPLSEAPAPNGVYVLHVRRESQDGVAVPRIVAGLPEQGYGFATVETL